MESKAILNDIDILTKVIHGLESVFKGHWIIGGHWILIGWSPFIKIRFFINMKNIIRLIYLVKDNINIVGFLTPLRKLRFDATYFWAKFKLEYILTIFVNLPPSSNKIIAQLY